MTCPNYKWSLANLYCIIFSTCKYKILTINDCASLALFHCEIYANSDGPRGKWLSGLISVFPRIRWQSISYSCQLQAAAQKQSEPHACVRSLTQNKNRLCMSESLQNVSFFFFFFFSNLCCTFWQIVSGACFSCPCGGDWAGTWSLIMGAGDLSAPLCNCDVPGVMRRLTWTATFICSARNSVSWELGGRM